MGEKNKHFVVKAGLSIEIPSDVGEETVRFLVRSIDRAMEGTQDNGKSCTCDIETSDFRRESGHGMQARYSRGHLQYLASLSGARISQPEMKRRRNSRGEKSEA